jgi:hypothetical protein
METCVTILALILIPTIFIGIGFKIRSFTIENPERVEEKEK